MKQKYLSRAIKLFTPFVVYLKLYGVPDVPFEDQVEVHLSEHDNRWNKIALLSNETQTKKGYVALENKKQRLVSLGDNKWNKYAIKNVSEGL